MRRKFTRAQVARIDKAWHNYQLAIDAPRIEQQHQSSVLNFAIIDKMPVRARKLLDELGPEAPAWANEWFAIGHDPGHRQA